MTATRWWVKTYARWIARVQAVQGQLNLFFTAMSGVSLASGALKYFGAPTWAVVLFLCFMGAAIIGYVYLYSEGGVWNQKQRDSMDMSDNFAAPGVYIGSQIQMRAIGSALDAQQNGEDPEQAAQETVTKAWKEYRDGVDLDELENGHDETDLEEIEQ